MFDLSLAPLAPLQGNKVAPADEIPEIPEAAEASPEVVGGALPLAPARMLSAADQNKQFLQNLAAQKAAKVANAAGLQPDSGTLPGTPVPN